MGHAVFLLLHLLAVLLFGPVFLFVTIPAHLLYGAMRKPDATDHEAPRPDTHVRCPRLQGAGAKRSARVQALRLQADSANGERVVINPIIVPLFTFVLPSLGPGYSDAECAVAGNVESGIYHVAGTYHHRRLVSTGKARPLHVACFASEADAARAGYRKSKR